MKKLIIAFLVCLSIQANSQNNVLGYRFDIQTHVNYVTNDRVDKNKPNGDYDFNYNLNIKQCNFRMAGSFLGSKLFDEDSKFFIGEYLGVGMGVGMGKSMVYTYDPAGAKEFFGDILVSASLGLASSYNVNEKLTLGFKFNIWTFDLYFDFNDMPFNSAYLTYEPAIRFDKFLGSFSFKTYDRTAKNESYFVAGVYDIYKSFDAQFKYFFKEDAYFGARWQYFYLYDENDSETMSNELSTYGITLGFFVH
jgi:hypothetical protein